MDNLFAGFGEEKKCGDCKFIRRRKFSGGTVIHYCSIRYGNNNVGMLKVKCKDFGCSKYEDNQ